jgi:integrase
MDKATAQRIAAEEEAREWRRHLDGPGAHVTFAQAALAYRRSEKPTRFLDKIEDHWRDMPLRDIRPSLVRAACLTLLPNAKPATRNRQVIVPTMAIVNFAAELDWCAPLKVRRFKVNPKVKIPATPEWVAAFAAHASPHLGAMCLFMFSTGARLSEAVRLTWADVDLLERKATIRQTKIDDTRRAHLPPQVVAAIANIPSNREPEAPVFAYSDRGSVKQPWDNTIKRAGIVRLTPHCCRHGFATTMLRKGFDVKTVAKLGGWKDAVTVLKTYAHALEDDSVTDALFGTKLTQDSGAAIATTLKGREKSA